jgi:hypothetical protein
MSEFTAGRRITPTAADLGLPDKRNRGVGEWRAVAVTASEAFDFAARLAAMPRDDLRALWHQVAEDAHDKATSPAEGHAFDLLAQMLAQVGR